MKSRKERGEATIIGLLQIAFVVFLLFWEQFPCLEPVEEFVTTLGSEFLCFARRCYASVLAYERTGYAHNRSPIDE